ncbi:MAG: bifunctional DNA-formamidopyrimidine glycosylase/DNA-(apurinic or apyrimidinic site) lyase [Casimicrobiaceae bacterium]|nr:bifunctional DNA-formamidopyrimidine glycosylase/DNA-(apurinic or apyrimidinic site) lyase [Casimicrobiaceae bacterium]MDW8312049.1 bifunctional DNA-formamidopyrimidine glycosylase/DNA-(apurinic or apyrimidinic site) lyase [Burkholderiales bacterium]
MPELPEVETVRRGLAERLIGRRIEAVTLRQRCLRWPISSGFEQALIGRCVQGLDRRGKYLQLRLSGGVTWLVHLGMSGQLRAHDRRALPSPGRHDHLDVLFDGDIAIRYSDPRRFGSMHVYAGSDDAQPLLARLGFEPLSPELTAAALWARLRGRRLAIKQALMDATIVAGVGNIYANEALFRAGIRPSIPAGRLGRARCERLVAALRQVLQEAIAAGGSTLRDFLHADGNTGTFQLDYFVYGRLNQPCRRCGSRLRGVRLGNRASIYCPRCQR